MPILSTVVRPCRRGVIADQKKPIYKLMGYFWFAMLTCCDTTTKYESGFILPLVCTLPVGFVPLIAQLSSVFLSYKSLPPPGMKVITQNNDISSD